MELYLKLIDVIAPVFFVIGIGYYLGKKNPEINTDFITTFAGNVNSSGNITISNATPTIYLTYTDNNPDYSININGGHFEVRDVTNNSSRLQILSGGTVRSFGNFIAAKDLDVDGHTNLDNVRVAGVTTFARIN